MVSLNKLRARYWVIDPGYLNLKNAAKTILAILISLWLVRDEGVLTRAIACIASAVAIQGVAGNTFIARLVHIIIFDTVYFLTLALGFVVHNPPQLTAFVLVILGFAVNYIRRFGLEKSMVPMSIWILCFLASSLPLKENIPLNALGYGIGAGFLVSAIVALFIFPDNHLRLFIHNSNQFFHGLSSGLKEMRRYALVATEPVDFSHLPFVTIKTRLEQLIESNLVIQQNSTFSMVEKQINHIVIHQFALVNAYSLFIEVFHSLWLSKHPLSRAAKLSLSEMFKVFSHLFATTRVDNHYKTSTTNDIIILPILAARLGQMSLSTPSLIMALLNFKLGFDLLSQNEKKLLRGADET